MIELQEFVSKELLPSSRFSHQNERWRFSRKIKNFILEKTYKNGATPLLEELKSQLPNASIKEFSNFEALEKTFSFVAKDHLKDFSLKAFPRAYEITLEGENSLDLKSKALRNEFKNTILFFRLKERASLNYLGEILGEEDSFNTNSHYFDLAAHAKLTWGRVFNEGAHFEQAYFKLGKKSFAQVCTLNLGTIFFRDHLEVSLGEMESHITLNGLYKLKAKEHSDTYACIHHKAPETTSAQLYKGILDDQSEGSFTGKVHVHKDAQLINAEQLNKTLLLSDQAKANSRPQLEIFADDVKCSHGSTTGQISPEEVFYLQSRGISKTKAMEILSKGFALDVLLKLEKGPIQEKLKKFL